MKNKKVWGIILIFTFTLVFSLLLQTNLLVYAASDSSTIDVGDNSADQTLPTWVEYKNSVFTISTGGSITVIGTTNTNTIVVSKSAINLTLTLSNVSIISPSNLNKTPIDIQGNAIVNIVLADGTTNTLDGYQKAGLHVPSGATVNISGTGTLNAKAAGLAAGIGGGSQESAGTVNIIGGTINAKGGAGIGGGSNGGSGGTITISGGTINTTGSGAGAGIGGGYGGSGGTITISGGTVNAVSEYVQGAGIGGGYSGSGGTITISGGTINAKGGKEGGAGIGGGYKGSGGTITISDGEVTTTGGSRGAGIGGGEEGSEVIITISGGTVTATGGVNAAGIGAGYKGNSGTITISGGTVSATGGDGPGILDNGVGIGGNLDTAGKITIKNAIVTAKGGNFGAAIGSGNGDSIYKQVWGLGGVIEIQNSTVSAISGSLAAAIGGGHFGSGGNITIKNSNVKATANHGAGIGSGDSGAGSTITISESIVNATGENYGAGIGGGSYSASGTITISGSKIIASGNLGAGIGEGAYGAGDTGSIITITGSAVTVTGIKGAGIGGGYQTSSGTITINESTVNATGSEGAGIGGGTSGAGGTITISGSVVNATGTFGASIGGGSSGAGGTITISGSAINATGFYGSGIGGGTGGSGGKIIIDNSSTISAISYGSKNAVDAVSGSDSRGYLINAKLNLAISSNTSSFIKINSKSLELPANYLSFAYSATTDSIIKAYLDSELKTVLGSIVTVVGEKTLIPITNLATSPTSLTLVKKVDEIVEQDPNNSAAILNVSDGKNLPGVYTYTSNVFTISTGGSITVTGITTTNTIVVATGVKNLTLTLSGTSITDSSKSPIDIQGNAIVNIVLADGTTNTLDASKALWQAGLSVPSGTAINISGTGTLITKGYIRGAGIGGGDQQSGGTINISSGTINATGGTFGAGIGGGYAGSGGTITISGGTINATGGENAAGIGGGHIQYGKSGNGGMITIRGGTINAIGGNTAAGIGGGQRGEGGTTNIFDGTVIASGGYSGAGIGGGYYGSGGIIKIDDGIINTTGGEYAAGIGGGSNGSGGTITINDGTVNATAGEGGSGIGGGVLANGGTITISHGTINASGDQGAGIGGGAGGDGGIITIRGGEVTASCGTYGAGIGGGDEKSGGIINISGATINATGGSDAAGIGGGRSGSGGIINIKGGNIKSVGKDNAQNNKIGGAGIGGGSYGTGGTITISGSAINSSGSYGSGIGGGGSSGTGGTITIDNSSTVTAISIGRKAIDAVNDSSGYIINAQLDSAISTTTSSYIKLPSNTLELPANYKNFAYSATTDSIIKAYSDSEFKTVIGSIVTNEANPKTLIPVTDLSKDPTNVTQVKKATAIEEQDTTNSDATLSSLTIDGTTINNFSYSTLTYNMELAAGTTTVPTVAATVNDTGKANAVVEAATSLPGSTTVLVTAEDGTTTKTYTINFTVASNNNTKPSSNKSSSNYYKPVVDILVNGKIETSAQVSITKLSDKTVTKITLDDKKVEEKLKQEGNNSVITIPVNSNTNVAIGTLNGQTVKNMENKEAVLEVKKDNVTYTLPASQINIDAVSEKIGKQVELKDIEVNVKISEPTVEILKKAEETINKNKYDIVVKPIEFEITCTSGNQTVEVSRFNSYVERIVAIPEGIDPSKITTGIVINEDGTFSHIPTNVYVQDNKYFAKLNSLTNSTYTVIWKPIEVASVENHWSKAAVNDMASRLIVKSPETFSPDYNITRGEFADYITKALGIYRTNTTITKKYSDISAEDEIAISVTIASEYGIIKGYPDNTFRPEARITREEAMTMYARAMNIVKLAVEDENRIQNFQDKNLISDWAYDSVKSAVGAKVFNGKTLDTLDPQGTFTSAESATAIRNLLIKAKLINE